MEREKSFQWGNSHAWGDLYAQIMLTDDKSVLDASL